MKQENENICKLFPAHGEDYISDPERAEAESFAFPPFPHNHASDDIYNKEKKVDLNTEDFGKIKSHENKPEKRNEKDFYEDVTGEDLDVPGSEADEAEGNSGSEDEENIIIA